LKPGNNRRIDDRLAEHEAPQKVNSVISGARRLFEGNYFHTSVTIHPFPFSGVSYRKSTH
jgi:hypothetical protein